MIKSIDLPKNGPIRARQFLDFCGWQTPAPENSIQTALDFFLREVGRDILFEMDHDPSPWALPRGGPVYRLTSWMQAIDSSQPVRVYLASPNERFKAFLRRRARNAGNWYTLLSSRQESLAIPHNQTKVQIFKARTIFHCLESHVSDAYVDWARHDAVDPVPPEYRRGGGRQFFIWNANQRLAPV